LETGVGGVNRLEGYDTNSSNLLAVNGLTKIQTTSILNTINNTTNVLSVSGQSKITTTGSLNTISNLENIMTATAGSNAFDATLAHDFKVNSVNRMLINSTGTTMYGTTNFICYQTAKLNIEFGADTNLIKTYIDFHSNTTNNTDYDSRIISGQTSSASNAGSTLTAECSSFLLSYLTGGSTRAISVNSAGGIVLTSSDERLKENITPIDANSTHLKLLQLEPKNYEWIDKENRGEETEIGLIAQDVMKIMPELTFQSKDDMYGVHYDRIPTLLLQSVKELQRQINELKAEIAILKTTTN
jgi:hypothetical protein